MSRECSLCPFWYLVDKNFSYQKYLLDGCHDMSIKAVSMRDLAIVYVGGSACRINFAFMSLDEANNLMKSNAMTSKRGVL